MTERRWRVACVGAGYFARFHRDAWAAIPQTDAVAIADPNAEAAAATGLPAHDSAEAMLAALGPDLSDVLLDIAAPPAAHADLIRLGLSARVGAILCQKPFCGDLDAARAVTQEAAQAGIRLIVHENFRFQPWYRTLRAALDRGEIGEVHNLTFRLRPGDGQGPDAYLARQPYFQAMPRFLIHETGIHWIDTFRYLAGEPEAVFADLRRLNPAIAGEDAGLVIFRLASGARALFDGNRLLDHPAEDPRRTMGEALIEGTEGVLSLDGEGIVRRRVFGDSRWFQLENAVPIRSGFGGGCVEAFQTHAISSLASGEPAETEAASYVGNLSIESAIYKSSEIGAWQPLNGC
ncbi:MAG: Gfo/Idh/MocA family oxidoreductase [Pseudomonadota bacterium]